MQFFPAFYKLFEFILIKTVAADRSQSLYCAMKELKTRVGPLVGPGK